MPTFKQIEKAVAELVAHDEDEVVVVMGSYKSADYVGVWTAEEIADDLLSNFEYETGGGYMW